MFIRCNEIGYVNQNKPVPFVFSTWQVMAAHPEILVDGSPGTRIVLAGNTSYKVDIPFEELCKLVWAWDSQEKSQGNPPVQDLLKERRSINKKN